MKLLAALLVLTSSAPVWGMESPRRTTSERCPGAPRAKRRIAHTEGNGPDGIQRSLFADFNAVAEGATAATQNATHAVQLTFAAAGAPALTPDQESVLSQWFHNLQLAPAQALQHPADAHATDAEIGEDVDMEGSSEDVPM